MNYYPYLVSKAVLMPHGDISLILPDYSNHIFLDSFYLVHRKTTLSCMSDLALFSKKGIFPVLWCNK